MKRFVSAGAMAVALAIGISHSSAQEVYPSKPVRIVVPYSPTGGTPAEFAAVIRGVLQRFARPIKEAGIKPQ